MKKILIIIGIVTMIFMTGCQRGGTPPPDVKEFRENTDYNFLNLGKYCTTVHGINLTTNNDTYCGNVEGEDTVSYYKNDTGWSMMCCNLSNECVDDDNIDAFNLCNSTDEKVNTYVFNDDGFWLAQCCNEQGENCYVDKTVQPGNESTICDEEYNQNLYGTNYTGSGWESKCCIGGIEE